MGGGAGSRLVMRRMCGVADLALGDQVAHALEVGVEAAVEADLQLDACLVDGRQRAVDPRQIEVDRLLAEDVLARRGGLLDRSGRGCRCWSR